MVAPTGYIGVRIYRNRTRFGMNTITAGRRQIDLHRIEQMHKKHIAVTGELAEIPLEPLTEIAKIAQQKDHASRPSNTGKTHQSVLGMSRLVALRGRLRLPHRVLGYRLEQF